MLKNNVTVTAIRPRDGQQLAPVILGSKTGAVAPATVLQMILAELASLKQQVNALSVARPEVSQPVVVREQEDKPVPEKRLERRRLRKTFD